jgi:hypothetical protein
MNMKSLRSLVIAVVAGSVAACSGGSMQSTPPAVGGAASGQGSPAQLFARGLRNPIEQPSAMRHDTSRSWMLPEAKKKSQLLYVSGEADNDVYVYSYPQGKLEGTLTGFNDPAGLCTDRAGDVYITNGNGSTVDVYAHGGTVPLRTLALPGYPELSCSVDPKTGNFAIGTLVTGEVGEIAVFANGQGKAILYDPSGQEGIPGCAYDAHSNLYCDAYGTDNRAFVLYELPKNSSTVKTVSVSGVSGLKAGPMQWDGKYLTFATGATQPLYQIALSGSGGSIAGNTQLTGTGWVWQFWIDGKKVIVPTYAGSDPAEVGYFNYPAGGSAKKSISGFDQPDGATISTQKL